MDNKSVLDPQDIEFLEKCDREKTTDLESKKRHEVYMAWIDRIIERASKNLGISKRRMELENECIDTLMDDDSGEDLLGEYITEYN